MRNWYVRWIASDEIGYIIKEAPKDILHSFRGLFLWFLAKVSIVDIELQSALILLNTDGATGLQITGE